MSYLRFLATERRFLAFGFVMAFFSSFGQTFFVSLFGEQIRETFTLTHGGFGLCYSIATLCSGFTIIWVGQKLDAIDLRPFSVSLCVGLIVACLGMAFAPVVVALGAAIYLLRLFGQGLLSHTAMTSMARYFDAHRGKAISIAGLGHPAGEAVLPIIAVTVLAYVSWRQAWLGIAVLLAVFMIPMVVWLLRGHTTRHATHVSQLAADEAANGTMPTPRRQWTRRELIRDPRFYMLIPAVVAPGFIVTGLFFHQVHLVESKGWTMTMFAATFALFAGAQLPAGLLAGPLVDRIGATRLVPVCLAPFILSLVVLAASRQPVVAAAFMILSGITCGLFGPVVGSMWAEVYGVRHLGAIRALVTAIGVFATAASPFSMGWLIDGGTSMETIAMLSAGYVAGSAILAWLAVRGTTRQAPV